MFNNALSIFLLLFIYVCRRGKNLSELQKMTSYQDIRSSQVGKYDCAMCAERDRNGRRLQNYLSYKNNETTWMYNSQSLEHPDVFLF